MILKCDHCGHETEEGTLEFREYCKGCGRCPEDDSSEAWDKFLEQFDYTDE